ncbi:hypothetical protein STSO111631_03810 [Stackebrandtia soli]
MSARYTVDEKHKGQKVQSGKDHRPTLRKGHLWRRGGTSFPSQGKGASAYVAPPSRGPIGHVGAVETREIQRPEGTTCALTERFSVCVCPWLPCAGGRRRGGRSSWSPSDRGPWNFHPSASQVALDNPSRWSSATIRFAGKSGVDSPSTPSPDSAAAMAVSAAGVLVVAVAGKVDAGPRLGVETAAYSAFVAATSVGRCDELLIDICPRCFVTANNVVGL